MFPQHTVEQDRASHVLPHHAELARDATPQPRIVIELIANTTTKTGLKIRCELDSNTYPKGIKVSDAEMATLNMTQSLIHPEWNYSISPRFHEMKQ